MQFTSKIRFIDRYIGSIICWGLTLVHKLRPHKKPARIKNVLVIELVEMGAAVMAYPSLSYIRRTNPDANIYCLCLNSTKELWMMLDVLPPGHVFAVDNRSTWRLFVSLVRQIRALSKKDIDLIIDYELFTRISAIVSFFIKSKFRAGFYSYTMGGLYRGNFLDVKCYFNQNMHISKNLLALTKSAVTLSSEYYNWNAPIPNEEIVLPVLVPDVSSKESVLGKLEHASAGQEGPLILVAPTVGKMLPMRDYPKELYVEVVRGLLKAHPTHRIVLVGTPGHMGPCQYIADAVQDPRCINFCGQTATLRELMELMSEAQMLLSNDSGNPHFAAMAGLKTLSIFGPETPFMYGPLGKAVCLYSFFHTNPSITTYNHKNPPSMDRASLRAIAPAQVLEAARGVMDGTARFGTINNEIPYLL